MDTLLISFSADVIPGAGRGKILGTPTINMSTANLPEMEHGIYACWTEIDGKKERSVMHFGPRPVYNDPVATCEVHLLDRVIKTTPESLQVTVVGYIREVRDFPTVDAMRYEIERDIDRARAMLAGA